MIKLHNYAKGENDLMANLSNQVYIYSLSTDEFFNEEERNIKLLKDRLHDMKL
ncbi:hypothetical protein [Peribacillus butanolivorans]